MPSKFYADLHVHSTASDGSFTPAAAVENAARNGLSAIALTDHDTVDGIVEAIETGRSIGVKVMPGIEMGSDMGNKDIHILGYFVDYKRRSFIKYLREMEKKRLSRAEEMCGKLSAKGLDICIEDALSQAPGNILTRAHIARAVVAKGYAGSVNEVFNKHLGNGMPCFVPKYNLTSADVIKVIIKAGGLPVLAHPKLSGVDNAIEGFVGEGLAGIEVYCIDHKPEDIKRYLRIADKYGLIVTGGSDCHGPHMPGRFTMGSCGVDRKRFEALAERGKWNFT